ncbi:conserved hypothetical protein [Pyrobaculum islandicum DSM 4184]|uniref:Polysaccharide biosynthesis protein n=1 Tax=Pyrobaculum islandicum (strain DSM 4184 / JCM 9189 / GEO3) TaxID=384616 RepID=A1RQT7_PYRIL|nr:hypothetical protein [Pyrobaculum islandicum]ABL87319.1 conserved hypothetical protein [Pyrobaculum islandicum DSM 4184]
MERAVKSAAWITAATVVTTVSGLVFWSLAARLGGRAGLGAAAYEVAAANVASALLNIGLQSYTLRFVSDRGGSALATAYTAAALLSLAGGAALAALGFDWAPLLLASSLFFAASAGALIASGFSAGYFYSALTGAVLKLALPFFAAPLFAFTVASIASAAVAGVYAARRVGLSKPGGWGDFLAAGLSNYAVNFSVSFAVSLGVVIAGALGNTGQAGVLYLLAMAVLAASSVAGALAQASVPVMVEGGTSLAERGVRIAVGINVPLAIAAAGASYVLMSLLGREYVEDAPSLAAAMPAVVELSAISMASAIYNVEKRWLDLAILGVVGSASVAVSSALLPPGVALAVGFIPPFLISLRAVPQAPLLIGLGLTVVFTPVAYISGVLGGLLAAAGAASVLHVLGVFNVKDYIRLAKIVLSRSP